MADNEKPMGIMKGKGVRSKEAEIPKYGACV